MKRVHQLLLMLLTASLYPGMAWSGYEDEPFLNRAYLTPALAYGFFNESNLEPDDAPGGQITLGLHLTDNIAIEGNYAVFDGVELDNTNNGEVDVDAYGFSGLFYPAPEYVGLYLALGFGAGEYSFDNVAGLSDEDSDFVDYGLGFLQPVFEIAGRNIALRAEYRRRKTVVEPNNNNDLTFRNNLVTVGLQIPLGAASEPPPPPSPAPEPSPAEPLDSDSDGDGIIDRNDNCPGTPEGVAVGPDGCPEEKARNIVLEGVNFKFNSAELTEGAERRLDNIVAALKAAPEVRVLIKGHTDNIDNDAVNLILSRHRAESVENYLADHGIDPRRLATRGFGEKRPIASNDTAEGRAKNRRVELEVIDSKITDE